MVYALKLRIVWLKDNSMLSVVEQLSSDYLFLITILMMSTIACYGWKEKKLEFKQISKNYSLTAHIHSHNSNVSILFCLISK